MQASLVREALHLAVATRGGHVAGVIFHSGEFRTLCAARGMQPAIRKTGVCWDNALLIADRLSLKPEP